MRRFPALLSLTLLVAACQPARERVVLRELPAPVAGPKTVSVLGDWVLATSPDSTVFVGAKEVELRLNMTDFTIRARYPNSADVVITGDARTDGSAGPMQLVPRQVSASAASGAPPVALVPGQPITFIASAAGQTLVFGELDPEAAPVPSSVWHRVDAARAAGTYEAAGKVEPEGKPRP